MSPAQLGTLFFLQLFAILSLSRAAGWAARRWLRQPQVVGEMIAGVVLGPSLFGLIAPHWQAELFPRPSLGLLYAVAQFGVGLYMFLVGLGFRSDDLRTEARSALAVSSAGVAAPFALGAAVTPWLIERHLFGAGVTSLQAALFTGAAISITAFPMLARIIHERGLSNSRLGALCLTAGALDDVGAWIVLAIVLATLAGKPALAIQTILGAAAFVLFMIWPVRRWLSQLEDRVLREGGEVSGGVLCLVLALFCACAFAMDAIGVHAVFGGFVLGSVMPRGVLASGLRQRLEPLVTAALLPVFFTYSGLSTQLGLIRSPELLLVALLLIVVSVVAKGGACWGAARLTGQDNAQALAVAALMNARGLMELIIANIGLQRGVIKPALFSVLVLMAIVTTLMACPLFDLAYGLRLKGVAISDEN